MLALNFLFLSLPAAILPHCDGLLSRVRKPKYTLPSYELLPGMLFITAQESDQYSSHPQLEEVV